MNKLPPCDHDECGPTHCSKGLDAVTCSRSSGSSAKLYAERPIEDLAEHYMRHLGAMTAEGLHSKSAIAAELAYRDHQIESLREKLMVIYGDACAIRDSWLLHQPDGIGRVIRNIRRLSISSENETRTPTHE